MGAKWNDKHTVKSWLNRIKVTIVLYTDNTVPLAESGSELDRIVFIFRDVRRKMILEVNASTSLVLETN